MENSPLVTAALILLVVGALGAVIAWWRGRSTYAGYEELAGDARQIAVSLKAEIFRDGQDLVIAGNHGKLPTVIRFSYAENAPGLNLRMQVPATFAFSIVPKGTQSGEGRAPVRTGDELFDAKFLSRSDQPTQAHMLLGSKRTLAQIQKLCCSSRTFLSMATGSLELSELVIPAPYTARHVLDHVQSMGAVGKALEDMPGAETVKIRALKKEHTSWLTRAVVAAGVVAAAIAVYSAAHSQATTIQASAGNRLPEGIRPVDAVRIPGVMNNWRLAGEDDFAGGAVAWIRQSGVTAEGRILGDFSGRQSGQDVAYVLISNAGLRRIVLLASQENRYDTGFSELAGVARVPKQQISNLEWTTPPQGQPEGDGLLLIRKADDLGSGAILFLQGKRIASGVPVSYQSVNLR